MKLKSFLSVNVGSIITSLLCGFAWANSHENITSEPTKIHLRNGDNKIVQLLRVNLSPLQRKALSNNVSFRLNNPNHHYLYQKANDLPSNVENGMNKIPVLDQGAWGTCATFAATAAVDALYGLTGTRSVSQLCNLELGRTIQNPDETGGWEGSFGYLVLQQIAQYGYMPQSYEISKICGGLSEYPTDNPYDNGDPMSVDIFMQDSVKTFSANDWKPILSYADHVEPLELEVGEKILDEVKRYLFKGDRVLLGTLLDPDQDEAGAVGEYGRVENDTWVLTDAIKRDIDRGIIAGHELVITGYDDHACAEYTETPESGHAKPIVKKQCGILHLRNSWSIFAGDKGDYYMTYDYFKAMAIEAYAILNMQ